MIALGIEGTAHTISCGIVDQENILSNSSRTYHNPNGGIHPREAAQHHADHVKEVVDGAMQEAGLKLDNIDLITYSRGPGLGPCLRIAATAARTLSVKSRKPILGVNHPLGHVEIGRKVTGAKDPIMLYVSGGNTQVISHYNGRYRVMGETMDIGLGNLLDKLGRDLGFPFPGGPHIEKLALSGKELLELPYSVKGMDTSFSGIYTAAREHLRKGSSREDVCLSVQEYSFAMLLEVLERGLHQTSKNEILLAGGVAKNLRLREMISELAGPFLQGASIFRRCQAFWPQRRNTGLENPAMNQCTAPYPLERKYQKFWMQASWRYHEKSRKYHLPGPPHMTFLPILLNNPLP